MGYIKHNAIVLTTWDWEVVRLMLHKAQSLGLTPLGPAASSVNGYYTICIPPDGSKEGWPESDEADHARVQFKAWLQGQAYEDDSTPVEWVEVAYGSDDAAAEVVDDAWVTYRKTLDNGAEKV